MIRGQAPSIVYYAIVGLLIFAACLGPLQGAIASTFSQVDNLSQLELILFIGGVFIIFIIGVVLSLRRPSNVGGPGSL